MDLSKDEERDPEVDGRDPEPGCPEGGLAAFVKISYPDGKTVTQEQPLNPGVVAGPIKGEKTTLSLHYDAHDELLRAKKRMNAFQDEVEKSFPSCTLIFVIANSSGVFTSRSDLPNTTQALGSLDVLKDDILTHWRKQ